MGEPVFVFASSFSFFSFSFSVEGSDEEGEEEEEQNQVTREVVRLSQGATRAPLRLRHWVHWHVWVFFWGRRLMMLVRVGGLSR